MKNPFSPCDGCKGGLRCYVQSSPCYLMFCGAWPGTGPEYPMQKKKKENVNIVEPDFDPTHGLEYLGW